MSCQSCNETLTIPNTTLPPCPAGSPCEEFTLAGCTKYVGPNLPNAGVTNGMTLKEILVAINKKVNQATPSKTYTITVATDQTVTVVEYINHNGVFVSKSVSKDQSPQTICAQEGSPVKISGTGVLSAAGNTCTNVTT